jgi:hypothetical protein
MTKRLTIYRPIHEITSTERTAAIQYALASLPEAQQEQLLQEAAGIVRKLKVMHPTAQISQAGALEVLYCIGHLSVEHPLIAEALKASQEAAK